MQEATQAPQPAGDWYCPNHGYLSGACVTYHETCDTCHTPVVWHAVGVSQSAIDAAPELLEALELAVYHSGGTMTAVNEWAAKARAAIAKAKGSETA